jgi:hypothetical protein
VTPKKEPLDPLQKGLQLKRRIVLYSRLYSLYIGNSEIESEGRV